MTPDASGDVSETTERGPTHPRVTFRERKEGARTKIRETAVAFGAEHTVTSSSLCRRHPAGRAMRATRGDETTDGGVPSPRAAFALS